MPQSIQDETAEVEKKLWAELEVNQPIGDIETLEDRIQYPGSTRARMAFYDRSVTLFWVMKGLLTWVLENRKKEAGDVEPVQIWKEHYADARLMLKKIDMIAKNLAFGSCQGRLLGKMLPWSLRMRRKVERMAVPRFLENDLGPLFRLFSSVMTMLNSVFPCCVEVNMIVGHSTQHVNSLK